MQLIYRNVWLIMRLTTFFILLAMVTASASSNAQSVSLSGRNITLKAVFDAVKEQTGFTFFYRSEDLNGTKPVSLDLQNTPLPEFLNRVFERQHLAYNIQGKTVFVTKNPVASITSTPPVITRANSDAVLVLAYPEVRGRVVDSLGNPLQGASVRVLNTEGERTTLQTKTNSDGYFELKNVPEGYLLEISYVGHLSSTVHASADVGHLTLRTVQSELQEVELFSTGYQTIPKERSTGSFEGISNADLTKRVSANILDKLEGQVPGLQYDRRRTGSLDINVRGINTMSEGLMGPLIVVDNFPFEGNLQDINPNDVASVTILKDAAAASIWGARAGNGVIVINLKKPMEGRLNIDFSANYTVVEKARLKDVPRISTSDFIDVERMLFENGYFDAAYNSPYAKLTVFSPVIDMLFANRNEALSDVALEENIARLRNIDVRDQLQEYLYRNETLQQYALAVSGGNNINAYRMSVSYNGTEGTKIGDSDQNLSINLQNELKISNKFGLSARLMFLQHIGKSDANPMDYNFSPGGGRGPLYPYAELKNENGENLVVPYVYNRQYIETLAGGELLDWRFVPLDEVGLNTVNANRQHIDAQINLNYALTPWLKIDGLYNYQGSRAEDQFLRQQESFYTRDLINRFTQINEEGVQHIVPLGAINQMGNQRMQSQKIRGNLRLNKDFLNGEHSINIVTGAELSAMTLNTADYTVFGYDPLLMTNQQVDLRNIYPTFDGLAGNARIPTTEGFLETTRRYVSLFANAAYTWRQKYTASFSARRDASNLFGVNINDKWNPLWSAGLAWSLDRENFLKEVSWVDGLRMRATYGHSGNSGGVATSLPTISYVSGSSANLTSFPRAMVSSLPNPYLKWEDVRMINLALSFDIFKRALSGSVEYFNKKSTDLLSQDNIDPTAGLSSVRRNVGVLAGSGWDLKLAGRASIGNVQSSTTVFLSMVKDVVKEYRGNISNVGTYVANAGGSLRPLPDRQLYPVFALRFEGLDGENGDPQGWRNGEVSKEYQQLLRDSLQHALYYGTGLPPRHGSLNQSISWKDLSLSFLISYKFGHYFQKPTVRYYALFNSWLGHGDFAHRWQKPGDENFTTVPSMPYPANNLRDDFYAYSEANIEKGDLIRLQDVNLSYRFMSSIGGKKYTLNVFGAVNNVALLWTASESGLDPDYFNIPPSRRYSMGISCKF